MSRIRYFVRLAGEESLVFEEVSENIYNRRTQAINDAGNARYGDQRFIVKGDAEFLECNLTGLSVAVLAHLCRLFSVRTTDGVTGFIRVPTHVKLRGQRNSEILVEVASGQEFKLLKKAA